MSINAVNLAYVGLGPTDSAQVIADHTSGPKAKTLMGYGTASVDGTAVTFAVNFIDGTKGFGKQVVTTAGAVPVLTGVIPVFVDVFRSGNSSDSATAATSGVISIVPSSLSSTGFVANMSGNGTTSGVTISFGVIIAFSS